MKFKENPNPLQKLSLCTRCGKCLKVCPSYQVFLKESFSPRGRNFYLKNFIFSTSFDFCLFCEKCSEVCPHGISFPELYLLLVLKRRKTALVKKFFSSPLLTLLSFARNREKKKFSIALNNTHVKEKSVKVFLSCGLIFLYPSALEKFKNFLKKRGTDVELLGVECCGAPFLNIGSIKDFEKCALKNLKNIAEKLKEGDDLLFFCATCAWIFKNIYPLVFKGTEVEEKAKLVASRVKIAISYLENFEELKIFKKNVLFHQPCHLTETSNLVKNKEGSFCCGSVKFSLWKAGFQKKYKNRWIKQLRGKIYLATFCTGCYLNFKYLLREPPRVCHWLEFLECREK